MSLLRTTLRPKNVESTSTIAACSATTHHCPYAPRARRREQLQRQCDGNNERGALRRSQLRHQRTFEDIFIRSLVAAGSCKKHAASTIGVRLPVKTPEIHSLRPRRQQDVGRAQKRPFSASHAYNQTAAVAVPEEEPPDPGKNISRNKYEALVNTYNSPSDLWEQPLIPAPKPSVQTPAVREHVPLAPRIVITPEQESQPPHTPRVVLEPEDDEHRKQIKTFRIAMVGAKPRPGRIWHRYRALRTPRPRYLLDKDIRNLFRLLSWVEFKDLESQQRYFSLLDECQAERIPIMPNEWNTAISFAARWVRNVTGEEVKAAIETWMRMEKAGVQATNVTFNILFDAAARAGRFGLADTIFQEIKSRDMRLDRNFRTSMIFYAGLRRDGQAVRSAFRALVTAGEIVDTSVMNCVILSLLRAGEAASAENVFAKMKFLHSEKFGGTIGPRNWMERRVLDNKLDRTARLLRREEQEHESSFFGAAFSSADKKEEAQRNAPIHPDAHTCRMLIKHHALISGNLDRCRELIAETKAGGWNVHGSVYLSLFRGFGVHGGHAHTAWRRKALEETWEEFLQALDPDNHPASPEADPRSYSPFVEVEEQDREAYFHGEIPSNFEAFEEDDDAPELSNEETPPYFTPGLAKQALRAFYKCAGRKRMLEVWTEIQQRWITMNSDERARMEEVVRRLRMDDWTLA